jgi:ribonuclease HI
MARKFYVVWSGRQTGIFTDWATAQQSVNGYSGASFKSFDTRAEAEEAFRGSGVTNTSSQIPSHPKSGASVGKGRARPPASRFDVAIYCDGACDPNPGHAGSGVVVYRKGLLAQLWYGLYNPRGTNNTAELNALYHALRIAEAEIEGGNTVAIFSDSLYSIKCIQTWAPGWEKRGWKRMDGDIKNLQVIQDCYAIYRRIRHRLLLAHVAGHAGTEGNELADRMAMLGAQRRERELRLYQENLDLRALLKMRPG